MLYQAVFPLLEAQTMPHYRKRSNNNSTLLQPIYKSSGVKIIDRPKCAYLYGKKKEEMLAAYSGVNTAMEKRRGLSKLCNNYQARLCPRSSQEESGVRSEPSETLNFQYTICEKVKQIIKHQTDVRLARASPVFQSSEKRKSNKIDPFSPWHQRRDKKKLGLFSQRVFKKIATKQSNLTVETKREVKNKKKLQRKKSKYELSPEMNPGLDIRKTSRNPTAASLDHKLMNRIIALENQTEKELDVEKIHAEENIPTQADINIDEIKETHNKIASRLQQVEVV